MSDKVLVIRAEDGRVVQSVIEEGKIEDVVKNYARRALNEWEPIYSDFVVLRDKYEVRLKLPISPEQFEKFSKYGLERTPDGYAVFSITIYTISFDNFWIEGSYQDRKMYLIAPYVDENIKKELEEAAAGSTLIQQTTMGGGEVDFSELEEELEELEEEEKPKKTKRRRRRK